MIAADRSVLDFDKSSATYAAIRDRFKKESARCSGLARALDPKRAREASILLAFLLQYERLPARRVCLGDHPDFRFSVGDRRIGMELVEAFVPHPNDRPDNKNRGN